MYLTIKQQLKHLSTDDYRNLRELCRASKNLMNELVIQQFTISNQIFVLPYSRQYGAEHSKITIKVPPILEGKKVKFIKIYPLNDAKYFEIQYIYEVTEDRRELDKQKALAIDFGVNNLMTCATSEGQTFIIDGRRLKAINQWYNKINAQLASIKDKQKYGKKPTFKQKQIARKRKLRVNDYISKACRKVIDYCLLHNIGNLVCGYNVTFQRDSHMGKKNNQNFVNIPFGEIRQKLQYLCELYGIEYTEQEESYTSQASFWDKDVIPVYNADNPQKYEFSGKRIHRGLYQTSTGFLFNADVNGALNILRKSNVVSLIGLYSRGGLATPARIRIKSNFLRTPCL